MKPRDAQPPVWARTEKSKPPLTTASVVQAAIELADAEGLTAVSMRRIAERLGARVMSLYTHVSSKDDLLDLMFEELAAQCIVRPRRGEEWPATLRRMARRWRKIALAHPWCVEIISRRAPVGPQTLHLLDSWVAALHAVSASLADKWAAATVLNDYVVGYVVRECAQRAVLPDDPDEARQWLAATRTYLARMADSGDYPNVGPLLRDGYAQPSDTFELGLDVIVDSLRARFGDN